MVKGRQRQALLLKVVLEGFPLFPPFLFVWLLNDGH